MSLVAKSPMAGPYEGGPAHAPKLRSFWQRWNRQTSLIVFMIGLGVLWVGVSALLVFEIQS